MAGITYKNIMIELKDVRKTYHIGDETIKAMAGVNLSIAEGEFVAIVGPSGSGKSTALHIIGGLDKPTSGKIIVNGQDLGIANDKELSVYRNKNVGFVFQTFNLHPTYTAQENVAIPGIFAGIAKSDRNRLAKESLAAVGLAERAKHRPNQLSGGERQRVSIARALINNPKILIADEPTGNLDTKTGKRIMDILYKLNKERNITLIVATHDPSLTEHAKRIIVMQDGKIVEERKNP
jgi:putative ABC transport system ATP-binding protein